jgi:outer membrane protein TolC
LGEARGRLIQAESGAEMGRAALREAMGLEPGARVDAADEVLPDFNVPLKRDTIIAHAVTRRGEVHLAQMGAEATQLEVCAQWARRFTLMGTTYSNAADIHARPIPPSQRDPDYKPGAIGPEMPDRLLGRQGTRAETAKQYANRAKAAADQARSLIALEADIAFVRWTSSVEKVKSSKESADAGKRSIKSLREAAGGVITKEEVIVTELAAAKAQASLNEALYDQVVAIANIERITAGGVRVNFPGR